jgi:hypothetical protein
VYRDLFIQRSDFFRAARSERWSHDPTKPTTLDDVDPEVFSAYVHCVNFGAESLECLTQDMMDKYPSFYQYEPTETGDNDKGSTSGNDGSAGGDGGGMEDIKMDGDGAAPDAEKSAAENISSIEDKPVEKFLVDLYLLADKLIDPVSANLAIDELVNVLETRGEYLGAALIHFVYESTTVDSPLRKLVRDHSMLDNATGTSNSDYFQNSEFPHDFIRDVLLEVWVINRHNADAKIRKVYCIKQLEPDRYHYPVDNAYEDSAESKPVAKEE